MRRISLITAILIVLALGEADAQETVFVVRHAERADGGAASTMMTSDPELSEAGRARAESLAAALRDTGITAIFVTEFKRTQQTAAPLAKKLGLQPIVVSSTASAALLEKVRATAGPVLVVGHSNTVPEVLLGLGIQNPPKLANSDYDNLFIVNRADKATLLRLHYR